MNIRDKYFGDYIKNVNSKRKIELDLSQKQDKLKVLKQSVSEIETKMKQDNNAEIARLKANSDSNKQEIMELKASMRETSKSFDRDAIAKEVEEEILKKNGDEVKKLQNKKNELLKESKNLDNELKVKQEEGKKIIEDATLVSHNNILLKEKSAGGLPSKLAEGFDEKYASELIEKHNLKSEKDIKTIASNLKKFGKLEDNIPVVSDLLFLALLILPMIVFSNFMFHSYGVFNIAVGAVSGVTIFFQKILSGFLGLLIGLLIGGIIGAIIALATGLVPVGIGVAAIASVVGFVREFSNTTGEALSDGVAGAIGNTGRVIALIGIFIILFFIVRGFECHKKITPVFLKIPFFRKKALENMEKNVKSDIELYYIVFYTSEFVCKIYELEYTKKINEIKKHINCIDRDLSKINANIQADIEQSTAKMLEIEKKKYNENNKSIIYNNGLITDKIKELEEKNKKISEEITKREKNFSSLVEEKKAEFKKKGNELERDIKQTESELKKCIDMIIAIVKKMEEYLTLDLEVTQGMLSENIYWEQSKKNGQFPELFQLKHNFKPILILYDADTVSENQKIDLLYPIIEEIMVEFFKNNSLETIQADIVDTYKGAIDLKSKPIYTIYSENLSAFYDGVNRIINYVAAYQNGNTWNDMIADEYNKTKQVDDLCKIKIASIVVPPVDLKKVTFDETMWTSVIKGKDKGFIPIFYVNQNDYDNYNPEKDSATTIGEIKKLFIEKDNIYRVNLQSKQMMR